MRPFLNNIFGRVMGYQEGGPTIGEAFDILGAEREKKRQQRIMGDHVIPEVRTQRGSTDSFRELEQWVKEAQIQRASDLHSVPTPQELAYGDYTPPSPPTQVMGAVAPGPVTSGYELPSRLEGRSPIDNLVLGDDTVETMLRNAARWAGTPHQSPQLIYRKPDTVEENAQYVTDYLDSILRYAPYYDLPPQDLAAMLMYESGWGGERFDGNLGGYGFITTPEGGVHDMGFRFGETTPQEQALNFMEHLYGTRYKGARNVDDFIARGYNSVNPEYSNTAKRVLNMLLAQ